MPCREPERSLYSIASAGHESNAAVALALQPTDPALLHYRSGAFYLARAAQVGPDGPGRPPGRGSARLGPTVTVEDLLRAKRRRPAACSSWTRPAVPGGVSGGVVAALVDAGYGGRLALVASKDSFIPLGDAAGLVLLSEAEIEEAALALCARP